MPFPTRRHPLLSRCLAVLACVLLLVAQAALSGHSHAHGPEHGHEHEQADGHSDDEAGLPCALCLFKAAGHDSATPPMSRPTTAVPAAARAWAAPARAEPVHGRTAHDRQARGPPPRSRVS